MFAMLRALMDRSKGLTRQARVLVKRDEVDAELDEELAFHLEMEARNNQQSGMSADEARRAALLAFHGVERTKELVREGRWVRVIEETMGDVKLAVRSLRRTPLFTTIAMLTLVGIGVNAALFALLNSLLYRAPGGIDASNVVWVDARSSMRQLAYPDYKDLGAATSHALVMAAYRDTNVGVAVGDGIATRAIAHLVSANYFDVLGVRPQIGRGFEAEEEPVGGASAVAVISDAMWRRVFGGNPTAVGAALRINGHPFTVIGIARPGFAGTHLTAGADLWLPIGAQPVAMPRGYDVLGTRAHGEFYVIGKLASGIDAARAQSLLRVASKNLPRDLDAARTRRPTLDVYPVKGWVRGESFRDMRTTLAAGWIITGLLLIIVCANIANLLLSRSAVRQREFGVRAALGARRSRLIRLLTTESIVLSFAAIPPALFIAFQAARGFERMFLSPIAPLNVTIDPRVLLFSIGTAVFSAIIFGVAPAVRFSRPDVMGILKGGGTAGLQRTRTQRAFVVAQVALSVVLLLAGALFLRLLQDSHKANIGFDPDHVAVATFDVYTRGLKADETEQLFRHMSNEIRHIPGVTNVSAPTFAPFKGGGMLASAVAQERRSDSTASIRVSAMGVSPGYFQVLSIPLVRGRYLGPADDLPAAPRAVVVSELFARKIWGSSDVVGRTVIIDEADEPTTVVGIVGDVRDTDLAGDFSPHAYLPYSHSLHLAESHLLVGTSRDPSLVLADVRRAIHNADPDLALFDLRTMRATIGEKMSFVSGIATLVASFGVVALFLAGIGLYGIVAFSVLGRTREIGVRVALGARPGGLVMEFVQQAVRLTLVGLIAGGALAFAFGKVLASIMEELQPADFGAAAGVAIVLLLISVVASIVPALRAGRVDAMTSLRSE